MTFQAGLKTIAYIDGFNLYHRALQDTPYRWCNPKALLEKVVGHGAVFAAAKYYTARVSAKIDPDAPAKQQMYLKALTTFTDIEIVYGSFEVQNKYRVLAKPMSGFKPSPDVVCVINPEEKGSDVNLGVHMVRDAFQGRYEQAVICTNDTDLFEPIRIVVQELNIPVILVTPVSVDPETKRVRAAKGLINAVGGKDNLYHIRKSHLEAALLPNPYVCALGLSYLMPASWSAGRMQR